MTEVGARLYWLTRTQSLDEALASLKEANHPSKVWEWPSNLINAALTAGIRGFERANETSEEARAN